MNPRRSPTPAAKHRSAVWVIVITSALWGLTFAQIDVLLDRIDPISLNVIRFGWAALVLLVFAVVQGVSLRPAIKPGIILGLLLSVGYAAQNLAIELNGGAVSGFLFTLYAIMTPIFAWFLLGERLSMRMLAAVALCGVGIVLTGSASMEPMLFLGVVIMVAGCVPFALHVVFTRKYAPGVDPVALVTVQTIVIALTSPFGYLFVEPNIQPLTGLGVGSLLWLAFVSSAASYVIVTWAQKHVSASLTAILLCIEPPVAAISSYLVGAEIQLLQWFGGAAIVAAMLMMTWPQRRGQTK